MSETKGDLISRKAAIDALLTLGFVWDDRLSDVEKEELDYAIHDIIMAYKERIEEMPSAQPEIVRCKNCKYRDADDFCTGRGYPNVLVPDDGFCDKGGRR